MKTILAVIGIGATGFGVGYVAYRYTRGGKSVKEDFGKLTDGLKEQFQSGKDYVKNLFTKPATQTPDPGAQAASAAA